MQKLNTLLHQNKPLAAIAAQLQAHQLLQQFWQAATPKVLSQNSVASSLNNSQLSVYANSAIVANKIKLMHASLLTQLQNLQINDTLFRECKVTAISVKVQVISTPKPTVKTPRTLSKQAAISLKNLADELLSKNKGESTLAQQLNNLAKKT